MTTPSEQNALLSQSCARLAEQFDEVLILVSWREPDGTHTGNWYAGNTMALREMAREYVASDEREKLARVIRRQVTE